MYGVEGLSSPFLNRSNAYKIPLPVRKIQDNATTASQYWVGVVYVDLYTITSVVDNQKEHENHSICVNIR